MSKILVTGGAGAIGTNLIQALIKNKNKVISWDNYSIGNRANHIDGAEYFDMDTQNTQLELLKE